MTEFLRLTPLYAGSWFARARDSQSIALIGPRSIPILQDWEDGVIDWQSGSLPVFDDLAGQSGRGAWWMQAHHDNWRAELVPDAIVWVRHTKRNDRGDIVPGRSKGIWRIGSVEIGPDRLLLEFADRLGDVH